MTKIDVFSDFNAEHCLRLSSRRTQILYPAMPIKLTFTAKRRALLTSKHTFTHTFAFSFVPHSHLAPVPCLSLMLQDGRWVKEGKMAASLRETDEPSTWFRCARVFLRYFGVAQLSGQLLWLRTTSRSRVLGASPSSAAFYIARICIIGLIWL